MSKKIVEDKWMKRAKEIKEEASWLQEQEVVTVIYDFGEDPETRFEEVETPRTDRRSGNQYVTTDYKIPIRMSDGSVGYRKVHRTVFSKIIDKFKALAKDGVVPATIQFQKDPYRPPAGRRY